MKEKLIQETKGTIEEPKQIEEISETVEPESVEQIQQIQPIHLEELEPELVEQVQPTEEKEPEQIEQVEQIETVEEPETEYKLEEQQEQPEQSEQPEQEQPQKTESGYTKEFEEMYLKLFGTKPVQKQENNEEKEENQIDDIATLGNTSVFDNIKEYQKPNYKFIGIVFNTYIIIEIDKEMYIIDQHAAHERILYEKIKANYYNDETKDSQLMLLPDIITLSHKEMEIAKDNMQMFRKAGFLIEEFGENTIKLTGVPEMCLDLETKEMFIETLDEIDSISRTAKQEIEEKFISTIACKVAEKANIALTKEEVDSLMNELLALPNPFSCPHGRPTAIKMSKYDIERKFARK